MQNSSPPRHLQHGPPAFAGGILPGRQAARIRALAGSNALPEERALADATVMTAWLTSAQQAEYGLTLRAAGDAGAFVQRLADERRVVLEEGADPVADEVAAAAAAERAARPVTLRVVETVLLVAALGCVVTLVVLGVWSDALEQVRGPATVPAEIWVLAATLLVTLVAAAIVGAVATRRRDRALLDWAVSRPGQLGRGIPVQRRLQGESAGPAILMAIGPALLVAAAVITICVSAAVLLITLLSPDDDPVSTLALWGIGGCLLALVAALGWNRWRGRRLELRIRRARAAEWLGPDPD